MQAQLDCFSGQLCKFNREELIAVALLLKKENVQKDIFISELEKQATAAAKDYQKLKADLEKTLHDYKALQKDYSRIAEHNVYLNNQLYGTHTEKLEKIVDNNPADIKDPLSEDTPVPKESTNKRTVKISGESKERKRKQKGDRKRKLDNLPRVTTYELNVEELDAKYGKGNWRIAFWNKTTIVCKLRPKLYVQEIYTPSLSVGLEHTMAYVESGNQLLPKSFASSTLVASIIFDKYMLGLPLYRQEKLYDELGLDISRQTMSNWLMKLGDTVFWPIYDLLQKKLVEQNYVQCDETYLTVIHDGRKSGSKSYFWVHRTSELLDCHPVIVAQFDKTRSTEPLREFYKNFNGVITCDAYSAYQTFSKENSSRVTLSNCWMHCRRRFAEAFNLIDKDSVSNEELNEQPEFKALQLIANIYHEEGQLKDIDAAERLRLRQQKIKPLVDIFFSYIESLDRNNPLYSGKLKEAVTYSLNQKELLCRFLGDAYIPIDNGSAERAIRPISIGRRNWLFCNTEAGAEISAIYYSIVETAQANGAEVYTYLRYILENMPKHLEGHDNSCLETMLPWSETYKAYESEKCQEICEFYTPVNQDPPKTPRKYKVA